MINNSIKNLQHQISELENRLSKFEKKTENIITSSNLSTWQNNLLNINIVNRKSIPIKTLDNTKNNNLYFQLTIKFFNYSNQDIKFDLLCNNIQIGTAQENFQNGLFEITVVGTYQDAISNSINVSASINPKENKQVTIFSTKLTLWGISQSEQYEYDAVLTSNHCVLTYISNGRLYYKKFIKELDANDFDFLYLNNSISHSLSTNNEDIFLFRVDPDGNLFFSEFLDNNEIFISKNGR